MDFSLSDVQLKFHSRIQEFVRTAILPVASELDRAHACPPEILRGLAAEGIFASDDYLSYVLALEEISKAWASVGALVSVHHSLVCYPIARFGTPEQQKKYLPDLRAGRLLGCYAFAEASAGSDAGAIQTTAVDAGDAFVLNGRKLFVTNGQQAGLALVYASTDSSKGRDGLSAFLVDTSSRGCSVGPADDKLGLHAAATVEMAFGECRVAKANLLGGLHRGFDIARAVVETGRIDIAAQAVGIAQACLDAGVAQAKQRKQFGKPIAEFEAIQWMLADMATEIEAARLLTHRAAARRARGEHDAALTLQSSMAKLYASEAANRAAFNALQIFGGHGYLAAYNVERYIRDARAMTLFEETSEIERLVIERELAKR